MESHPLHEAVANSNYAGVIGLVQSGYDVNTYYYDRTTALHMACLNGNMDIVYFLIDNGAWIDAQSSDDSTPLVDACCGGNKNCVQLLLNLGAKVNPPFVRSTPLHEAARKGFSEIVDLLIKAGANVHANDMVYGTALHAACAALPKPDIKCIKYLLNGGANVNAIITHTTPLHRIARNSQNLEAAELLLAYGANVHSKDNFGRTARQLISKESVFDLALAVAERNPRPLMELVRLVIRTHMGSSRLHKANTLDIPAVLVNYLT